MAQSSQRRESSEKGTGNRKGTSTGLVPLICVAHLARLFLGVGFGFDLGGGIGVLLGEALDAACGVDQLLLAGEEGMAIGADFDAQHVAFNG